MALAKRCLAASLALACLFGGAARPQQGVSLNPAPHTSAEAAVRYLRQTYPKALGIRLDYQSDHCGYDHSSAMDAGYIAVPDLSAASPAMQGDKQTVTRVMVGRPDRRILDTQLRSLRLNMWARSDPGGAIEALEASSEVWKTSVDIRAAEANSGILFRMLRNPPSPPHLPASVANMSVDQFLDLVALRFHGVVLFGVCEHPHIYHISFWTIDH